MEELLASWEISPEVIKKFTDNCITTEHLKDVIEGDLLKELVPSIGPRITIKNKIQEYLTSVTDTISKSTYDDFASINELDNISIDEVFVSKPVLPHFELKTLLMTTPCGKKDVNEDKIAWLKHNKEPWQQVIDYWTATYDIRSATDYETVADFVCEWNILNDVRGEALINIDFDKRYPNCHSNFFFKWDYFFNRVKELKEGSIKDNGLLNDLEEIKDETDNDTKAIKQIKLLCRLIPPKGRLNRKIKFSTIECIEGIVVNVTKPGDIQHTIDTVARKAQTSKTSVQPYIVACESQTAPSSYYLVIDTIKYNFSSATKALDTLFKCYHTLHATYPKASDHIYLIIQRSVYGIKTKYDNVVPYVADIILTIT